MSCSLDPLTFFDFFDFIPCFPLIKPLVPLIPKMFAKVLLFCEVQTPHQTDADASLNSLSIIKLVTLLVVQRVPINMSTINSVIIC